MHYQNQSHELKARRHFPHSLFHILVNSYETTYLCSLFYLSTITYTIHTLILDSMRELILPMKKSFFKKCALVISCSISEYILIVLYTISFQVEINILLENEKKILHMILSNVNGHIKRLVLDSYKEVQAILESKKKESNTYIKNDQPIKWK